MKTILVTQKIEKNKHNEILDCLDQRWHQLLIQCELKPILIPNDIQLMREITTSNSIKVNPLFFITLV